MNNSIFGERSELENRRKEGKPWERDVRFLEKMKRRERVK